MRRILIRSAKDPFLALTPEATLARNVFASNPGNMLFTQLSRGSTRSTTRSSSRWPMRSGPRS